VWLIIERMRVEDKGKGPAGVGALQEERKSPFMEILPLPRFLTKRPPQQDKRRTEPTKKRERCPVRRAQSEVMEPRLKRKRGTDRKGKGRLKTENSMISSENEEKRRREEKAPEQMAKLPGGRDLRAGKRGSGQFERRGVLPSGESPKGNKVG